MLQRILKKIIKPIETRAINKISTKVSGNLKKIVRKEIKRAFADPQKNSTRLALKETWEASSHFEHEEWDNIIKEISMKDESIRWITYQTYAEMPPEVASLLPEEQDEYDILDVGSGPRCAFGRSIQGKKVNLVCCDPLADYYKNSFSRYNIPTTIDILTVEGEKLIETFSYDQFDLVTARNCLDHAYDPEQAILQMLAVSKRRVLLLHCRNEGKTANYAGLHQWDFDAIDGHFVISCHADNSRVNFTQKYSHLFDFTIRTYEQEWNKVMQQWCELVLTKK